MRCCVQWRESLSCTESVVLTADGEGCVFDVPAMNVTATTCEEMTEHAEAAFADPGERGAFPWCYTADEAEGGAAEPRWGWCYERQVDHCAGASGCTACGARSWAGCDPAPPASDRGGAPCGPTCAGIRTPAGW